MSERRVVNCGSKTNKSGANGTSGNGKKLVIKPLKLRPTLPEAFEEETWCRLQAAVKAVQQQLPVACSFEELYRAVEDMCTHKLSAQTYTRLRECCDERVGSEVARLRSDLSLDTLQFLQRVNATWRRHCEQMMLIRSIFLYLDRSYVYPTVELGVRSIYDLGLRLFCQHLQQHGDVQQKIVEDLLLLVERERRGDAVDRSLLKSLIDMFSSLGIYSAIFQQPFLDQTGVFYTKEGESKMGSMDVAEYLLHCETRLQQEADRCITYLNESTKQQLILTVEKHLVTRHIETLLERGYTPLVEDMRVEDLARLYRLSFRINHLVHLRVHFKEMIKTFGRRIVMDQAKDAEMVESLLAFKERMDRIVTESFGQDQDFFNVMREAFENFINQRENKPAELIAKFLDAKLKQGSKGQTEDELELDLDRVLTLFRFIQGKDVFEAFYKKDLAKRLLLNRSASIDAEKSMITKLRSECGSQFTTKLEGMFKDIELSRELMNTFRTSAIARQQLPPGLELYVNVLTSGFWPTYPMIDVAMPEELAQYQSTFRDFYLSKHGGRHLVWQNSLGQCILKARFDAGPKELIVSLFQAVVLLLFNEEEEMSFEAIKQASKIEDRELRRTLQSLACGKVRVLLKEPKGREVGDDDLFRFYGGLKELRFRIKINTIQLKETPEENKKTNDQIMQDRQYQIDAAIVRIMKMRKMLSHKLLIQELVSQLKFSVRASDLKKRIESLIEREYLERSASEKDVYHYLA